MATFANAGDGHSYRMECEPIEVTSLGPRPDPNWTFTDAAGHEHDAKRELLDWLQDDPDDPPFYFDVDGDEHNADSHWECRLCGEWIEPGTTGPSPYREFIAGPKHYYRDDEPISEAEFADAIASRQGA